MARSAHPTLEHARQQAEARFRELIDELKLLTVAFPHLQDAYDPEDLPISFIMRRDASTPGPSARRTGKSVAKATSRARTKAKARAGSKKIVGD